MSVDPVDVVYVYVLFKQRTEYAMGISDWSSDVCSSVLQGAVRTMLAGLQTSTGDGVDALPALDHSPRQQQTPALDHGQDERDQQRQRQHDRDGPDLGLSRVFVGRLPSRPFCVGNQIPPLRGVANPVGTSVGWGTDVLGWIKDGV